MILMSKCDAIYLISNHYVLIVLVGDIIDILVLKICVHSCIIILLCSVFSH